MVSGIYVHCYTDGRTNISGVQILHYWVIFPNLKADCLCLRTFFHYDVAFLQQFQKRNHDCLRRSLHDRLEMSDSNRVIYCLQCEDNTLLTCLEWIPSACIICRWWRDLLTVCLSLTVVKSFVPMARPLACSTSCLN